MAKSYYGHPGTAIKQLLRLWGIREKGGCGCISLANEMDVDGPDKVEQRLEDYYIPAMDKSIREWRGKFVIKLPQPPQLAVKLLIEYGIKKAREKATAL